MLYCAGQKYRWLIFLVVPSERYALSMEDTMAARAFRRATNYGLAGPFNVHRSCSSDLLYNRPSTRCLLSYRTGITFRWAFLFVICVVCKFLVYNYPHHLTFFVPKTQHCSSYSWVGEMICWQQCLMFKTHRCQWRKLSWMTRWDN